MATLTVRLLGGLGIAYGDEDRSTHFSGRLRALLALLLLHADAPQSRQSLAYTLWPDSTDKQARTNLRKLLLLLRAALGPCADALIVTDHSVGWRGDTHFWLDIVAFDQLLTAACNARADAAINMLAQAVDLYRGDLLPDCYDEWILAAREQLRDRYINALAQLCTLYERAGRYADGVAAARRLLQHDPIYEHGHLHLIRLQALMQDRAGALQSYHHCATLLRRELGVDPSPALETLYLQLLDHEMPAPALSVSEQVATMPLVGRQAPWQTLLHRWQAAQQGQAHFVLIVGEAGIGKSRLAEEMILWVERQGNVAAYSRAYSSDNRTLTYAPIAGLLRVPTIRHGLTRLQPYWLSEVARLLPDLLTERDDVPPPQPMLDDWQRHHLFAALTQALQPNRRARLLVIDDLQWSDSETLAWLPHLLEGAKATKLLVVGTVRSEEFDDYPALQTLCETLERRGQCTKIALGPLPDGAIGELARLAAGQPLDAAHARWLTDATEGNPLFVIETARWLQDAGITVAPQANAVNPAAPLPLQMPQSVLTVIEARLARLSNRARTLAEVAATIGRSFTVPVLAAASAMDEDELVDALDELWRRRIVRERDADAYDFSHDRIRGGAYASISALRRRHLHKRVAAAILATQPQAAQDPRGEIHGQLGYHYEQANERAAAIEHYTQAATAAAAHYAHADALGYFDRGLALLPPDEMTTRFDLLLRRDRVLEISASIQLWEANLQQLDAVARTTPPDAPNHLVAMRRARALERKARATRSGGNLTHAVEVARAAMEFAEQCDDQQTQALCSYTYAFRLWFVGDFGAAIPYMERAIALARQLDDSNLLASALELRAQTHMFNGGSATTIAALLQECLVHYERVGSLVGRCQILNKLAYLPFAQGWGSYDEAEANCREAIELAHRMGTPHVAANPQRNLAIIYTCMGNYAAAEPCLVAAQELLWRMGETNEDPTLLNYRGFLYLSQGRLHDALAVQQRALEGLTTHGHAQWRVKALTALAWIYLRLAQSDEALSYAQLSFVECEKINEQRQLAYTLIVRGTLHTEAGNFAAARADFERARTILHHFEMWNRALEAEAGLAYLDFVTGEHEAARAGAQAILTHLEAHPLDFTNDVAQLLERCLQIVTALDAAALPRLRRIIDHHLSTRTATLDAPTLAHFWQVSIHATLRAACTVTMPLERDFQAARVTPLVQ